VVKLCRVVSPPLPGPPPQGGREKKLNIAALAVALAGFLYSMPTFAETLADEIIVEKSKRMLTLYNGRKVLKRYTHITLSDTKGAKTLEGDNKTPEGYYMIDRRLEKSEFHRALHISYPNMVDIGNAELLGKPPGDRIMIHGRPADFGMRHRKRDWTHGCIAVTNKEIDEIWLLVPDNTPIEIRP
jgi:murein L,D-transpeptidase YafK